MFQILKDEMTSDSAGMILFVSSKTGKYNCMRVLDEDSHINVNVMALDI